MNHVIILRVGNSVDSLHACLNASTYIDRHTWPDTHRAREGEVGADLGVSPVWSHSLTWTCIDLHRHIWPDTHRAREGEVGADLGFHQCFVMCLHICMMLG